jgi:type II secretory pathway component PulM
MHIILTSLGPTERYVSLAVGILAILGGVAHIVRIALRAVRVLNALLAELKANTAATRTVAAKVKEIDEKGSKPMQEVIARLPPAMP